MGTGPSSSGTSTNNGDEEEDDGIPPEQETLIAPPDDDEGEDTSDETPTGGATGAGATAGGGGGGGGPVPGVPNSPEPTGSEGPEESEETEENPEEDADDGGDPEPVPPETEPESRDEVDAQPEEEPEEDDKEEPQEAELTVYTDAWDATGWGLEPVFEKLEQRFGISFDLSYELLEPRELDGDDWNAASARYSMPYAQLVELPESTRTSTSALQVAKKLDQECFRDYLRHLRIAALVEGRNIENREFLVELAGDVGYDDNEFDENWNGNIEDSGQYEDTPIMWATAGDLEVPWRGHLEYAFAESVFLDRNVLPLGVPPDHHKLVAEYEPITTTEVTEILGINRDQAVTELRELDAVESTKYGDSVFWTTT